jgi:hypothetical protein
MIGSFNDWANRTTRRRSIAEIELAGLEVREMRMFKLRNRKGQAIRGAASPGGVATRFAGDRIDRHGWI